jgi:hypothetical protein
MSYNELAPDSPVLYCVFTIAVFGPRCTRTSPLTRLAATEAAEQKLPPYSKRGAGLDTRLPKAPRASDITSSYDKVLGGLKRF